jgi:hypothetical protein
MLLASRPALAGETFHELESKYLFGFTDGTDIGEEGEKEIEFETTGSYQMKRGRYNATEQEIEWEQVPSQYWGYELSLHGSSHQIAGVPGLDNRNVTNFSGLSWKPKWLIVGRGPGDPVGLSLSIQPEWERIDGTTGAHAANFSSEVRLAADTELIPNRLFAAANLVYAPEWARETGDPAWAQQSGVGLTGALTYRITPMVALGGETEYYRAYNGLGLDQYVGEAVYVGPTLYVQFTPKIYMAAAWSSQIAGHSVGDASRLDLTDYQRQRVNFKFGVEF